MLTLLNYNMVSWGKRKEKGKYHWITEKKT